MVSRNRSEGNNDTPLDLGVLVDKLAIVAKSLGVIALRFSPVRRKTDTDKIYFLEDLGFDKNEIASILGTTSATVNARLWERHSHSTEKKGKRKYGKDKQ